MVRSSGGPRSSQRALVACCVLSAGGCEIMRDPTAIPVDDGPIAVHAMLVAGERRMTVLITRFESVGTPSRDFDAPYRLVPVAGADVRVTGGGQSITLDDGATAEDCIVDGGSILTEEVPDSLAPGCYTGSAEDAVAPGTQYELNISLPDGSVVTGETEVPLPVTVSRPEAGASIEIRSSYPESDTAPPHALAWSHAGADRAVRLRLEVDLENCEGPWTTQEPESGGLRDPAFGFPQAIDLTGRDSAEVGGWFLSCADPPPDEVDGALQLAVFDLAYARYLDTLARSESIALADASLGVSGAVGVFTAAAVTRVPVRLIVRCPIHSCPRPD